MIRACITTRNGQPEFNTALALERATRRVPGAKWTTTSCPHDVCVSRNNAAHMAIKEGASHLFFVDNDTVIPVDALEELLRVNGDIVTGCVPNIPWRGQGKPCLTVGWDDGHGDPTWKAHWFHGVEEVDFCGAACLLIRTDVLEKIGFPWFQRGYEFRGDRLISYGEDIDFCKRAREAGFKIYAHGDVRCQHRTTVDPGTLLTEESDYWGSHLPVLKRISALHPKQIKEYGAGKYSTPYFLDQQRFPSLERLVSVEKSDRWSTPLDSRHVVSPSDVDGEFDVIFIDGETDTRALLYHQHAFDDKAIVVVHDIEDPSYGLAFEAGNYKYKAKFCPQGLPHTGLASNAFDVRDLI